MEAGGRGGSAEMPFDFPIHQVHSILVTTLLGPNRGFHTKEALMKITVMGGGVLGVPEALYLWRQTHSIEGDL